MSTTGLSRRSIRRVILVCCALLAVAAAAGVLTAATSDNKPADADRAEAARVVNEYETSCSIAWPADRLSTEVLPAADAAAISAEKRAVLQDVGTARFAKADAFDWPGLLQEVRDNDGVVVLATECKVLDVTMISFVGKDDMTVVAKVWNGETSGNWSEAIGRVEGIRRVDTAPVYRYHFLRVDGEWRIDDRQVVEMSADASFTLYGPDTPHENTPLAPDPETQVK